MTTQNNSSTATSKKAQINTSSVEYEIDKPIDKSEVMDASPFPHHTVIQSGKDVVIPVATQPVILPPTVETTVEAIDLLDTDERNTLWVSSCKTWLVLDGFRVYACQGLKSVQIGTMSKKGLVLNTSLPGSDSLGVLVSTANAKWNPLSKVKAEQAKVETQNKRRSELSSLFS